jgi:hypothetical protein
MNKEEILKLIKEDTVDGVQNIDVYLGCTIIQQYIKNKKDIDVIIDPTTIDNIISIQLFNIALNVAIEYYYN